MNTDKPGIGGTPFEVIVTKDWWFKDFAEMEKEELIKEINKRMEHRVTGNPTYFTPLWQELYVGYECELLDAAPPENDWKKWIVCEHDTFKLLKKWCQLGELRTPYLTKEQIENEGWKAGSNNMFDCLYNDRFYVSWYPETNRIEIGDEQSELGYAGEIKSINEFRYILKLLKIK